MLKVPGRRTRHVTRRVRSPGRRGAMDHGGPSPRAGRAGRTEDGRRSLLEISRARDGARSHMPIVPEKKDAKVAFYASKTTGWAASAVAIGTTTAAVTDLTTKVT